ncbi:MAG: HEPN domain-containing protein [Lachnospiraceae bacterium]|nr:HEPN domain-containing protein [Lachnospiraceae bacterium]
MCDIRLFRRAYMDYCAAVNLLKIPENDESYLNNVAYHLQQSVEKTLKAFLECVGVTVPNTHDIDKLVRMSRDNGSRVILTEWVKEKADMLTRWETDTRYDMDYYVELERIQEGVAGVREFLELNGLKKELRDELLDSSVMERLRSFFPKDYDPKDDFEWNCLYQVFSKRF